MRLLHARSRDGRPRPARPQPAAGRPHHPRSAVRQPVPVHGLRPHPRSGSRHDRGTGATMSVVEKTGAGTVVDGGIGESARRPDGGPKVRGEFAFPGDLWAEDMLWGQALRSPHASARIRSIDVTAALAIPGVQTVLTAEDLGGRNAYGLEHRDQPVLAGNVVRYCGEPVACV